LLFAVVVGTSSWGKVRFLAKHLTFSDPLFAATTWGCWCDIYSAVCLPLIKTFLAALGSGSYWFKFECEKEELEGAVCQ
jgi:hypothetical protein